MSDLIGLGDTVPFEIRLAETIEWCQNRASADDPQKSLRSNALQPPLLYNWSRRETVLQIVRGRGSYLSSQAILSVTSNKQLQGGKLLAYFPDADLNDGAAEVASNGFFNGYNEPAWDTWVSLFYDPTNAQGTCYSTMLVSWVPPVLLEFAEFGIAVNPEACIAWLSDVDNEISRTLKKAEILN